MTGQDIETVRAQYRESYHRKTAARRAKGLCVTCGKCPPTPGRTRCEPCAAKKRPGDRARHHRITAERVAQGLCPKCGKRPPAPERSQCEPCLEKDAAAGRAWDARLRAAGLPRRDPAREREYGRERTRRQTEARRAEGLCTACGKAPAVPGRASCEPCLEKRRASDRAKYAAGKAAGKLYGGADPEVRRRAARARGQRRRKLFLLEAGRGRLSETAGRLIQNGVRKPGRHAPARGRLHGEAVSSTRQGGEVAAILALAICERG